MEPIINQIHKYDEKMLRLQYEISECIEHKLTRGEIREDFIKQYINKKIKTTCLYKGIIFKEHLQSSQIDIIIAKSNAIDNAMGSHSLISAEDCLKVFEIKSKLNNTYLKELSDNARLIKKMNSDIKVGIFAYKLGIKEKNILKNFGFIYDKEYDMYEYDKSKVKEQNKNIDFVICIDENDAFFISKDNDEFILIKEKPIIKYFWPILKNNEVESNL